MLRMGKDVNCLFIPMGSLVPKRKIISSSLRRSRSSAPVVLHTPEIDMSEKLWPLELKCLETGQCWFPCLVCRRCSANRSPRRRTVEPMYSNPHLRHVIQYTYSTHCFDYNYFSWVVGGRMVMSFPSYHCGPGSSRGIAVCVSLNLP